MTRKMFYKIMANPNSNIEGTKYIYRLVDCDVSPFIQFKSKERIKRAVNAGWDEFCVEWEFWAFVQYPPRSWYVNGCDWDEFCKMFPNKNY